MRILLHTNGLNVRGTTIALLDYAKYLENEKYEVHVAYDMEDLSNNKSVIRDVKQKYETIPYRGRDLFTCNQKYNYEIAYFIKYGFDDGKLMHGALNLVHTVFQVYEPHGNQYFYVSNWLSSQMRKRNLGKILKGNLLSLDSFQPHLFSFVPHIVELPSIKRFDFFENFRLPDDAIICGRHGGFDTFDVPFVQNALVEEIQENKRLYLFLVNTRRFSNHNRIIHLPEITSRAETANFLGSLDFYVHARKRGETFGLSLLEAMLMRVPILSFRGGVDGNHRYLLRDSGDSLFNNHLELRKKIHNLNSYSDIERNYSIAKTFNSDIVGPKLISKFTGNN